MSEITFQEAYEQARKVRRTKVAIAMKTKMLDLTLDSTQKHKLGIDIRRTVG